MHRVLFTSLSVLALGAAPALASPVVYDQPAVIGGTSRASQNDPTPGGFGDFAKAYDNFTLAQPTSITDVHWTGLYFSPPGVPPQLGTIQSFLIQIWSDASGPGTLLHSETFAGNANETPVAGFTFSYSVDLTSAFAAQAGTPYWLSIQPTMVFPPQWGWVEGAGGDGQSVQDFLGVRGTVSHDLAFSLTGTAAPAVPEPGSLLLVALALAGAGVARRSRRTR